MKSGRWLRLLLSRLHTRVKRSQGRFPQISPQLPQLPQLPHLNLLHRPLPFPIPVSRVQNNPPPSDTYYLPPTNLTYLRYAAWLVDVTDLASGLASGYLVLLYSLLTSLCFISCIQRKHYRCSY